MCSLGNCNDFNRSYKLVDLRSCEGLSYSRPSCPVPPPVPPVVSNPMISVRDPTSVLLIPALPLPPVGTPLTGWEADLIVDNANLFDNATGIFTAPVNGDYNINLVINYTTSLVLSVDPELTTIPTAEIRDVTTDTQLLSSQFPANNVLINVVTPPIDLVVSSLIGRGQVIINATIPLVAGQRIQARVYANGLLYPSVLPIGPAQLTPALPARIVFNQPSADTTLTIEKVRNTPLLV